MGFFTWRAAKGTKKQVQAMRRDDARRAATESDPFRLETTTPEEAMRLAALKKRQRDLYRALERENVGKVKPSLFLASAGADPWVGRNVDAVRAAVRLVVCDGVSIEKAASRVGEAARAAQTL